VLAEEERLSGQGAKLGVGLDQRQRLTQRGEEALSVGGEPLALRAHGAELELVREDGAARGLNPTPDVPREVFAERRILLKEPR
jgi:hypothetical protein